MLKDINSGTEEVSLPQKETFYNQTLTLNIYSGEDTGCGCVIEAVK